MSIVYKLIESQYMTGYLFFNLDLFINDAKGTNGEGAHSFHFYWNSEKFKIIVWQFGQSGHMFTNGNVFMKQNAMAWSCFSLGVINVVTVDTNEIGALVTKVKGRFFVYIWKIVKISISSPMA